MNTGRLIMAEHPVQGWLPATDVLWNWPYQWQVSNRCPQPFRLWHCLFSGDQLVGWIKQNPRGRAAKGVRDGNTKFCEICGTSMYVTASTAEKKFCSRKCHQTQRQRDRLKGLVF